MIPPVQEGAMIEATCGNSLMITMKTMEENQPLLIKEINADDLVFIAKMSDGLFGSIHLAKMKMVTDDHKVEEQNVIVKSLNENVRENQK